MVVLRKAQTGRRLVPIVTGALLLVLGFLAFRNSFGFDPTGAVTLHNTTFSSTFFVNNQTVSIPVNDALVGFNSQEHIYINAGGREINITGSISVHHFDGMIMWDEERIIAKGTMDSIHGDNLDIAWKRRERATITLSSGVADIIGMNLSSFSEEIIGEVRLERRWSARVVDAPFAMTGFEGRAYFQRINNETILVFDGHADVFNVEEENLLKRLV